jgi:hypothetical protein
VEEHTFLRARHLVRPFSAHAGVTCRGYSGPLQRRLTDFGAEKSFARAAQQVWEHYGIEVSAGAVRSITQAHGERLLQAPEIVQGPARTEAVPQLIAETDGSMIPTVEIDEEAAGDRRKTRQVGWKEARLSLVYAEGSVEPVFAVTTGSCDRVGEQLARCAQRVGIGPHTRVHGIGDGAPWIPNQLEAAFGAQASYLIDFGHLCEYLSPAGKHCANDPEAWVDTQKTRMKSGESNAVLEALAPRLEAPTVDEKDAPVRACHRYIANRPGQFEYARALAAELPIGSGHIESAHRYVIQQRLKLSGAWWKLANAAKMLALRATRANGNWGAYWEATEAA